jgi:hypothetical protein
MKILSTLALILAMNQALIAAPGFTVTMRNSGSFVTVYIRPTATFTEGISTLDFYIRYPSSQNVVFQDPVENTTAFPGMASGPSGFELFTGVDGAFKYVEFLYTAPRPIIPAQTYTVNQEYAVFTAYANGDMPTANLQLVHKSDETPVYLGIQGQFGGDLRPTDAAGVLDFNNFFYPSPSSTGTGGDTYYFMTLNNVALPLILIDFTGKVVDKTAYLSWETSEERNISHYDIEKSSDGKTFTKIGVVKANNLPTVYSASDDQFSESSYYRLKINELDGKSSLSKIIYLTQSEKGGLKIRRDTEGSFAIETDDKIEAVFVSNTIGQILKATKDKRLFITDLNAGIYLISVKTNKGFSSQKFFKE